MFIESNMGFWGMQNAMAKVLGLSVHYLALKIQNIIFWPFFQDVFYIPRDYFKKKSLLFVVPSKNLMNGPKKFFKNSAKGPGTCTIAFCKPENPL